MKTTIRTLALTLLPLAAMAQTPAESMLQLLVPPQDACQTNPQSQACEMLKAQDWWTVNGIACYAKVKGYADGQSAVTPAASLSQKFLDCLTDAHKKGAN